MRARTKGAACVMYWIYDYPTWAIGLLFYVVFIGFTWIGIFLTRATVHSWIHREPRTNNMVATALSGFFVLFGLLLGLVAVATYQNFSNVSDIVDKETSSLSALYRDFGAYPQPIRGHLQDALREYTRFTIEEGWDQQRHGVVPTRGSKLITSVLQILLTFEPSKESEKIVHAEALRQYNKKVEFGRARLSNINAGLPAVLWHVVAFGAVMSIILIWMLDMEIHVHLILGGILAAVLAALIFLIAELDHPFRGRVSVGPASIERVYKTVMQSEDAGAPLLQR
jgi:Protein of unknown function (DUF4239)